MNKIIILISFVFMISLISSANAQECGSTPFDGCEITQDTTFNPGTYYFPEYGVTIAASDVHLNCNGANLVDNGAWRVLSNVYQDNTIIENCNFDGGMIWISANDNFVFRNNVMKDSNAEALKMFNIDGIIIENNEFVNNMGASNSGSVIISRSENVTFKNNVVAHNNKGLVIANVAYGTVENNNISHNALLGGLHLRDSLGFDIINNTFVNNTEYAGLYVYSSCDLNVFNNTINENNKGMTISIQDHPNLPAGIPSNPIYVTTCVEGLNIENNTFVENKENGIKVERFFDSWNTNFNNLDTVVRYNEFTRTNPDEIITTGVPESAIFLLHNKNNFKINNNTFVDNYLNDIGLYGDNHNVEIFNNNGIGKSTTRGIAASGCSICTGIWNVTNDIYIHHNEFENYLDAITFNGLYAYSIWPGDRGPGNINIYNNNLHNNVNGVSIANSENILVYENNIHNNNYGFHSYGSSDYGNVYFFLNNIYNNNIYNAYQDPFQNPDHELSYLGYGNFWGHSNPPCFVIGIDSNKINWIDDFAYCSPANKNVFAVPITNWGWKFVSFTPFADKTDTEEVMKTAEGKYEIIKYFVNGENKQYDPTSPPFLNTLQDMYPWYGYWMKITSIPQLHNIVVIGDRIEDCHEITLRAGSTPKHWIGYWLDAPKETGAALSSLEGRYEYVRKYENGVWETYIDSLPQFSDLKEMEPGSGYLIKITSDADLDYICE